MGRFLQLHLLTFYPPANINRDDTGRPKTAIMGGEPRLRVSSQALKRAWRKSDIFDGKLKGHLADRTQRIGLAVERHLLSNGTDASIARKVARDIAGVFGKVKKENDDNPTHTEQLVFVSPNEKEAAFAIAEARAVGADEAKLAELASKIFMERDRAADIAMFGRMLTDDQDDKGIKRAIYSREAAVSVAHAVTTHRVVVEDDYYTAVDDLKLPSEDAGAGFIGEAGFGSGVFYLYLVVDRARLVKNLDGDRALAGTAVAALTEAAAKVGPRGKSASFASFARTSFMLAECGDAAPRTLAAAFIQPIDKLEGRHNDFLGVSISALTDTHKKFAAAYPDDVPASVSFSVPDGTGSINDVIAFATDGL